MSSRHVLPRIATVVVLAAALLVPLQAADRSVAFSGSGSCSSGTCDFCSNVTLHSYGAQTPDLGDRCAYGYFVGANSVENSHPGGATYMCAGMKTDSNGGGSNVGPVGVSCAPNTYDILTPYAGDTAGYATIINHDSTYHYSFYGHASY